MTRTFEKQILVAGVGNAWLQDDAFGGECARRLEAAGVPSGVTVMDFGTGGLDLAYEIMRGYDALVIIDASRRGGEPGTLYVIEPEEPEAPDPDEVPPLDAHGMDPGAVLALLGVLGGHVDRLLVVGCEPAVADEGMSLSPAVEAAVDPAVTLVQDLINEHRVPSLGGGRKQGGTTT